MGIRFNLLWALWLLSAQLALSVAEGQSSLRKLHLHSCLPFAICNGDGDALSALALDITAN